MNILGISAFYHDSAAALLVDGEIIAAAQEERFTRRRHDSSLPKESIAYCLREAELQFSDVDRVVFYDKPFLKFERLLETYMAYAPRGFRSFAKSMPLWITEKLFQKNTIRLELQQLAPHYDWENRLLFSEHHLSHAASAYFPSGFQEALVLTMDGVGEWATTSVAIGRGQHLHIEKEIHFPHSLGLLYSAATYHAGFKVNSGEYKLMGLAPYGKPVFKQKILDHLIDLKEDGSFHLNMKYFGFGTELKMTNKHFEELFGFSARKPESPLLQVHMDFAASVQAALDIIVLRIAKSLRTFYGIPNICLAGGVALNCVTNGRLLKEKIFDHIWIQPAAGDAGGALGAALVAHHLSPSSREKSLPPALAGTPLTSAGFDSMKGAFLGPRFSIDEIKHALISFGSRFEVLSDEEIVRCTAEDLANGRAVGWFQGRMEFGPRSLGSRSILADPRSADAQRNLNLKIKKRESFRPFAPAVLAEETPKWFDIKTESPYMLFIADVLPGVRIPAVTHVDSSARVQTVSEKTNPRFHALLKKFHELTHCPVLVNTSFNVRGEPIVCSPADAIRCFLTTDLDTLVIENCYLRKDQQAVDPSRIGKRSFELD